MKYHKKLYVLLKFNQNRPKKIPYLYKKQEMLSVNFSTKKVQFDHTRIEFYGTYKTKSNAYTGTAS